MPSTGFVPFLLAESVGPGDVAWENPINALDDDSDSSRAEMEDLEESETLILRSPNLVLPSPITITDITYRLRRTLASGGSVVVNWLSIHPVKGGVAVGDDIRGTEASVSGDMCSYGGGLMGTTWDRSDIGPNMGIAIRATMEGPPPETGSALVFAAWVNITYDIETVTGTGSGTLPGFQGFGQGKIIGSGGATLPGLTGKAHHRIN